MSAATSAVLRLEGVGKRYPAGSAVGIREVLLRRPSPRPWALQPIDLTIEPGARLALLGRNGSGKSTLLGLAAGTVTPTAGAVHRAIDPTLLFQVGTSFDEELSGSENVRLDLLLRGLGGARLERAVGAAAEIAGIGGDIEEPLRTFSAGMRARLAMGAALADPTELLLIDEILAVSDEAFVAQCVSLLRDLSKRGVALVFVTHDPHLAEALGEESIVLDAGAVIARGGVSEGLEAYHALYGHR